MGLFLGLNSLTAWESSYLAERTRFELVVRNDPYVGLANRWFQPLTHLSNQHHVSVKRDYKYTTFLVFSHTVRKIVKFFSNILELLKLSLYLQSRNGNAEIAQLVERNLAKVEVAGPSPVFRSKRWTTVLVAVVRRFWQIRPRASDLNTPGQVQK